MGMPGYTEQFSERCAILATIDPASLTAADYDSDIIDMKYWRRVAIILITGVMGNNGTAQIAVKVNTANSTSSPTPVSVTGKAFTASSFSGSGSGTAGGTNHQGIIEVTAEECEAALDGGRYLFARLTIGTATSIAGLVILGIDSRYGPAADYDLSDVREIIA
jgi:hypothetical protein